MTIRRIQLLTYTLAAAFSLALCAWGQQPQQAPATAPKPPHARVTSGYLSNGDYALVVVCPEGWYPHWDYRKSSHLGGIKTDSELHVRLAEMRSLPCQRFKVSPKK